MKTRVTPLWRAVIVVLTMLGILLALNAAFYWNPFGIVILPNSYLFFLLGCFLPMVFLIFPVKKGLQTNGVPWYDAGVALLVIVICAYFGWNGEDIINMGWDKSLSFPAIALVFSFALWGIALEALRRTAGLIVTGIASYFLSTLSWLWKSRFPSCKGSNTGWPIPLESTSWEMKALWGSRFKLPARS